MEYDYSIVKDDYGNTLFKFSKELRLLEYVFEDLGSFGEPVFGEYIKNVITGKSELEEVEGNMCCLLIRKDFTIISSEFVSGDMSDTLQVESKQLSLLIDKWEIEHR